MKLSQYVVVALYNGLDFHGRKQIQNDIEVKSMFDVQVRHGSQLEAFANTIAAMMDAVEHRASHEGAIFEANYNLSDYEVKPSLMNILNASVVYLSSTASVLNVPVFTADSGYDKDISIMSPEVFNAYRKSFSVTSKSTFFDGSDKYQYTQVSLNDLQALVDSTGSMRLLASDGAIVPEVTWLLQIQIKVSDDALPLTKSLTDKEVVLWLSR